MRVRDHVRSSFTTQAVRTLGAAGVILALLLPTLGPERSAALAGGPGDIPAWSKLTLQQRDQLRAAYSKPPANWPPPVVDSSVKWIELGTLTDVEHPKDNPYSIEKVILGKRLFFDPRLSGNKQVACATCHNPVRGWANGRTGRLDNPLWKMSRDPPGLLNSGLLPRLYWDGRAASLEEQARLAFRNPEEMNSTEKLVVQRIAAVAEYRTRFKRVFGVDRITVAEVARAIAAFERTLSGGRSEFDQFVKGDSLSLSDEAINGLHIFRTDGRCMNCHHGPNFTDNRFHGVGLTYYGRRYEDLGRYYVTEKPGDVGRFRTPSLRNMGRTGPYMHRGTFPLKGVLNMLNIGMPTIKPKEHDGNDPLFPKKSPLFRPLGLNPLEIEYLKTFLQSLSEREGLDAQVGRLARPARWKHGDTDCTDTRTTR